MNERTKVYLGLEVHKETLAIAQAAPGRGTARLVGEIGHDVNRLVKRWPASGGACRVRGRAQGLWFAAQAADAGLPMRDHRALADSEAGGRPGEDGSARLFAPG